MESTVGIGILGAGTVGGALIRRLVDDHAAIAAKAGLDIPVRRVAVRDLARQRPFTVADGVLTDDPWRVVNDPEVVKALAAHRADVFLTAAYGQKLSKAVLELPGTYALNLHGSLLPRHRGASPVQHAILCGDQVTGVTLMTMTSRMDGGPVHAKIEVPIEKDDNGGTLMEKLSDAAQKLLIDSADAIAGGSLPSEEQNEEEATLAPTLALRRCQRHIAAAHLLCYPALPTMSKTKTTPRRRHSAGPPPRK